MLWLCINQWLPPGGHPRGTHGNPGAFVEIVRYLLPEGVGEDITFVHRNCTPGSRPWGFAGQRCTLSTIPGCCSRRSLRALVARDLGLELTKFRQHACYNPWSSDGNKKKAVLANSLRRIYQLRYGRCGLLRIP